MTRQQIQRDRSEAAFTVTPLWGATVCGALALFVYVATLCPTVTNRGDAGELSAASHMLGIGHPSGYPLFMMLGKLFEQIPVGSLIFRFNLISAFFGALTVGVVFLLTQLLTKCPTAPVLASLIFAFSPSFWGQAEFAEVYTLNAFFFGSVLYAALRWHQCEDERWLFGGALMFGFGLTNHMTIALLPPCLLVLLMANPHRALRHLPLAIAFVVAGFALNVYMPIRAAHRPALDGGYVSESLGFAKMFFGKSYLKEFVKDKPNEIVSGIVVFATIMAANVLYLLVPVGCIGFWTQVRGQRAVALALALAFAPLPPFFILYGQPGVQYFLIPSLLVFALWAGVGWDATAPRAPRAFLSGAVIALLATQFMISLPICDARADRISATYAESILNHVGRNATIIINDDIIAWPLYYYRYVEERRPDVKLVFDHHGPVWRKTIAKEWSRGPVYTAFWYDGLDDRKELTLIPSGPVGRVVKNAELPPADEREFDALPSCEREFAQGKLLRFRMEEMNLAPRQMTMVQTLWQLDAGAPEDYEVRLLAQHQQAGGAKEGQGMMRIHGHVLRFEPEPGVRSLGVAFARHGRLNNEGTLIAHNMLFTVPEDAEPGRYDLRMALMRKGESEEKAWSEARSVGQFTVWSIRSSTVL